MIEYYMNHPGYAILVIILAIAALFALVMAGKSGARRNRENEKIIKKLKEENELRNEFAILTESKVKDADPIKLFKGISLNIQKRVADKSDMPAEFNTLTDNEKWYYSLYIFFEDSEEKMSDFFRINTKPLTTETLRGLDVIIGGRLSEIYKAQYDAFDEDNEEVSVIKEEINALDEEAKSLLQGDELYKKCGEYIRSTYKEKQK